MLEELFYMFVGFFIGYMLLMPIKIIIFPWQKNLNLKFIDILGNKYMYNKKNIN